MNDLQAYKNKRVLELITKAIARGEAAVAYATPLPQKTKLTLFVNQQGRDI